MKLPEDFPTPYNFPLPIGGIPDHYDFIPSLLFIACYLAPFVFAIRKALTPGKRITITINSTFVPIERLVILSFRAIMSRDNCVGEESRKNWGMFEYTQASSGLSTFALLDEVSWLLNCVCLLATRENVPYDEWREQAPGGDQGRARAEERKRIRSHSMWFSCTILLVMGIHSGLPILCAISAITEGAVKWTTTLRFLIYALGAGYALSIVLASIRVEREVTPLKIELVHTFRRQAMAISLVFIYRCVVSFARTNDLTHPTNDPLATISKLFFYLIQLPIELAICWNHASTDYRTVVDAGATGDLPRKARENGKKKRKRPATFLKDAITSMLLRFKGQHRLPVSDSSSDIIPLMRTKTPTQSQTSTLVSIDHGDIEKQTILSIPSISSRFGTLMSTATDANSTYLIEETQKGQLSVPCPPLVEDIGVWVPRRPIWDQ